MPPRAGRERLEAAGITPCPDCRWIRGEVQQPCDYHAGELRRASLDHFRKFPREAECSHCTCYHEGRRPGARRCCLCGAWPEAIGGPRAR